MLGYYIENQSFSMNSFNFFYNLCLLFFYKLFYNQAPKVNMTLSIPAELVLFINSW